MDRGSGRVRCGGSRGGAGSSAGVSRPEPGCGCAVSSWPRLSMLVRMLAGTGESSDRVCSASGRHIRALQVGRRDEGGGRAGDWDERGG